MSSFCKFINIFEVYRGDFLQGFFVKDSQEFEDWMRMIRSSLSGGRLQSVKGGFES